MDSSNQNTRNKRFKGKVISQLVSYECASSVLRSTNTKSKLKSVLIAMKLDIMVRDLYTKVTVKSGYLMKMTVHMTCFPFSTVSNKVVVGDLMIIIRNINNF